MRLSARNRRQGSGKEGSYGHAMSNAKSQEKLMYGALVLAAKHGPGVYSRQGEAIFFLVSSAEFMGRLRFGEPSQVVI